MTGADFQAKLDAIVRDLQTSGRGQRVSLMFRDVHNAPTSLTLSSLPDGTVNAAELAVVQKTVDALKTAADAYQPYSDAVKLANDNLKTASMPYDAEIKAIYDAQSALKTKLTADPNYQTAKLAAYNARNSDDYKTSSFAYTSQNVSENYSELVAAKSKYVNTGGVPQNETADRAAQIGK